MNKQELIAEVAQRAGLTKKDASMAVNAMLEAIKTSLSKKDAVRLIGFGTFDVKKRAARKGRNPRTGAELKIPARNAVVFRPANALKDIVNK